MRELGKRLRIAREKAGCDTIEEGARLTRLPHSTLADYEAGRRVPGAAALEQMARRYFVSSDWLLGLPTVAS